jgi:hypothetical protein
MLIVGPPAWFTLRFTNSESGLAYFAIGVARAALVGPGLDGHKLEAFPMALLGGAAGELTLLIFWQIAKIQFRGAQ